MTSRAGQQRIAAACGAGGHDRLRAGRNGRGAALSNAAIELIGSGCPADINDDYSVGVDDLVNVITLWGTADPDADVNGDLIVDVNDLIEVITNWGSCP